MNRRITAALSAVCLAGVGLFASTVQASAADGDQLIVNGDFSAGVDIGAESSTDFTWTDNTFKPYGTPGMYDPGYYTIASNPATVHEAWATFPEGDPKMIVNGFTTQGGQVVWQQTVTPQTCEAGQNIRFDFSAAATNILRTDWQGGGNIGANISVTVGGVSAGQFDLTTNDPGNYVSFSALDVPWAPTLDVVITNDATVFTGNDFAVDDISLVQKGGCFTPVAAEFNISPTAPDCDAEGFLDTSVFPITRDGYTLNVDRQFDGPGIYTITAVPDATHFISGPTSTTVTVLPRVTVGCCVPTATIHQWYNWTGGPVTSAPAANDPKWHAVNGDPRSENHKWENHPTNAPYFVSNGGKGKGDWFKWETIPGHTCS